MGVMLVKSHLPVTSTAIKNFLLQIHNKKTFDHENEDQSDGALHAQLCHSSANIKIYESHYILKRVALAFTISEILAFQIFDLEKGMSTLWGNTIRNDDIRR